MEQNNNQPVINKPNNLQELKNLYNQFLPFLTPQNKEILGALIHEMEKGMENANYQTLKNIAGQMEDQAKQAEEALQNQF
ncbi:MAG: hypothetical protein RR396_04750 [Clostridiales bacterium]